MRPAVRDGESCDLSLLGAFENANGLSVVSVPVRDLAIGPGREQLGLVRVVAQVLEHRRLEEAESARLRRQVPDDTGPVGAGRDSKRVVFFEADAPYAPAVLLKTHFHHLRLPEHLPHPNLALHAAG